MASLELKGGDLLRKRLEDLGRKLKTGGTLRVGFLENATYPDGTSVATVAAIQNFGAPAAGIPPRPFFTNAVQQGSAEWGGKLGRILEANDWDAHRSLSILGEVVAGDIRKSIVDTNAPPLHPATVAAKGFSKPLVDSGIMLASVDYDVVTDQGTTRSSDKPEGISDEVFEAAQAERRGTLRDRAVGGS